MLIVVYAGRLAIRTHVDDARAMRPEIPEDAGVGVVVVELALDLKLLGDGGQGIETPKAVLNGEPDQLAADGFLSGGHNPGVPTGPIRRTETEASRR